jgi:hypothetical protein
MIDIDIIIDIDAIIDIDYMPLILAIDIFAIDTFID